MLAPDATHPTNLITKPVPTPAFLKKIEEVQKKLPDTWGDIMPTSGKGPGFKWKDPKNIKGNEVRVDQGVLNNTQHVQQIDHARVTSNGVAIGRNGKPIVGTVKANYEMAHIPLTEYLKWKAWNKPN